MALKTCLAKITARVIITRIGQEDGEDQLVLRQDSFFDARKELNERYFSHSVDARYLHDGVVDEKCGGQISPGRCITDVADECRPVS